MRLAIKSMRTRSVLATTLGIFILFGCSSAPVKPKEMPRGDYEYTKQYISWLIQKEMKKHDVKGLSIALVDDQQVVWAEGFGFADVAKGVPATPETVYRVASISKLFTVTAAMQLVEQNKIDIDKPLQTYLPEFSIKTRFPDASPITPRTIMTHHSGLPSDRLKGRFVLNPAPFTQLVTEIKDEYVAYPPNFIFNYSNLAIGLLGHMIERVSSKDFVSYMEEEVSRPLGMTHSSFVLRRDIKPLLAKGYINDKAVDVEDLPMRNLPASSLYANVLDLARFIQMVFAGGQSGARQILKPETLAEMLRPQNSNVPLDFDFRIGLGWFLGNPGVPGAGLSAGHGGDLLVFFSDLMTLPEHKLGVVVLANTASSSHVVFHVATTALRLALEAKTGITPSVPAKTPKPKVVTLPQEVLKSYEGQYITMAGLISIDSKGGHLRAETTDRTLHLLPQAGGWFSATYKILGLIPRNLEDLLFSFAAVSGREVVILRHGDQDLLFGEKIQPKPIPESWLNLVGVYEIMNQDDSLLIKEVGLHDRDGVLFIDAQGELPIMPGAGQKVRLPISPISDTEAVILGPGFGMGETIQAVKIDGEERLRYSGYEARKKSK